MLGGKYRLGEMLGHGGMGTVYRADDVVLRAPVAVKVQILDDEEGETEAERTANVRFLREARAASVIRSPHVVQVLDYGIDGDVAYLVMELLEGEDLASRLRRVGRLSPSETLRVLTHVGRAVGRAHDAGILHRDLKPSNIFIVRNDDEEIIKVLDFGLAKALSPVDLSTAPMATDSATMLGTPPYMSPEQVEGNREVDHRADLWALGVIAYECLCGKRAFTGANLGELVLQICAFPLPVPSDHADVPPGFDAWFARAVARDPSERFGSARELVQALADAFVCQAETLPPPNEPTRSVRAAPSASKASPHASSRSNTSRFWRGGSLALSLAGVATVVFWLARSQAPAATRDLRAAVPEVSAQTDPTTKPSAEAPQATPSPSPSLLPAPSARMAINAVADAVDALPEGGSKGSGRARPPPSRSTPRTRAKPPPSKATASPSATASALHIDLGI